MVSILVWGLAVGRGIYQQRLWGNGANGAKRLPHEWEYVGLRLFAFFVLTDALRAWDLCFATDAQLTDGACRSTLGLIPLWLRALAWWARDMTLLVGLAYFLDFTSGWTHAVIGHDVPKDLRLITRIGVPSVCVGMSVCAAGLVMSNRAIWMFCLVGWVAVLNLGTVTVAVQLLFRVLPNVEATLRARKLTVTTEAQLLLLQVRVVSIGMLVMAAAVFAGFLPICAMRLREGALQWSLVPWRVPGECIGSVRFPTLSSLPETVTPNPVPEAVELMIGWALLVGCVLSACGCDSGIATSSQGFVGRIELGAALLRGQVDQKQE